MARGDEIAFAEYSAMMVDAAYDELYRAMKPGMSENQAVGLVSKVLYDLGSEYVEAVNAISGERCNPHPHVFSDRVLRPGDPVYYDILHSYMGYRTCYYRCFTIGYASHAMNDAYKRCREYLDAAIELVRPGRTTAEIASVWPKAQEFGFPNEEAAFALAVWSRNRPRDLGEASDQPTGFDGAFVRDQARHGVCSGNILAFDRWLERGSHRRRNRCHGNRPRSDHTFPGGRTAGGRPALFHGGWPLPAIRETEAAPSKRVREMIEASSTAGTYRRRRLGCGNYLSAVISNEVSNPEMPASRAGIPNYADQCCHARARNGSGNWKTHFLAEKRR